MNYFSMLLYYIENDAPYLNTFLIWKHYYTCYSPSLRLFTVHTAFGLPGNSDTAISDTSKPFLNTLKEDLGPRPHNMYNCGVSSPAKSATLHDIMGDNDSISSTRTKLWSGLGAKKKVSPSSKGIAELNSSSSSSSPKRAIWYR